MGLVGTFLIILTKKGKISTGKSNRLQYTDYRNKLLLKEVNSLLKCININCTGHNKISVCYQNEIELACDAFSICILKL